MGLELGVTPVLSMYVACLVMVPAAYVYSLPPASGTPFWLNCSFGTGARLTLTAMAYLSSHVVMAAVPEPLVPT